MMKQNVTTGTEISNFSNIAYWTLTPTETTGNTVNYTVASTGYTGNEVIAQGNDNTNTYWNFDFSALTNSTNPVVLACLVDSSIDDIVCVTDAAKGIEEITATPSIHDMKIHIQPEDDIGDDASITVGIISDIFAFGEGINDAIYRLELAETDADSNTKALLCCNRPTHSKFLCK
jgi:hypothetical protein